MWGCIHYSIIRFQLNWFVDCKVIPAAYFINTPSTPTHIVKLIYLIVSLIC